MLELLFAILFIAVCAWLLSRRSRLRLRMRLELLTLTTAILLLGSYVIAKRFEGGLGVVTHLSDRFPWGLWIAFDLCGIALAAGGFVIAATVHVLHLRQFEPILKPAVLTSFIAYLLVAAILVLDLGRPYRFWHPLIMWQPHSVMFEITMCLTLYTVVLVLEFSPVLLERLGWTRLSHSVHQVTLPVVMLGVILSTLHQSSFGSLFLIIPQKLHPLWYTPILPVVFFLSSACAGLAMLIMESHLCATFLGQQFSPALLAGLARGCSRLLWIYLAVKAADSGWRGSWQALGHPPWLGALFLSEVIIGVIVPAIWLGRCAATGRLRGLVAAAGCVMGGIILNRLSVCWFGLLPFTGFAYAPSWMEWMSTATLALAGVVAFVAVARFLPVFASSVTSGR